MSCTPCLFIGRDVLKLGQEADTKYQRTDPCAIAWCNGYESWATLPLYFGGTLALSWLVRALQRQ